MSLTVPADLLEQARHGEVDDAEFLDCVRTSLPYAWSVIGDLITDLGAGDADFADNEVPPPDEAARGQLLRLMASDAMRARRRAALRCPAGIPELPPRRRLPSRGGRGARRLHVGPRAAAQPAPRPRQLLTRSNRCPAPGPARHRGPGRGRRFPPAGSVIDSVTRRAGRAPGEVDERFIVGRTALRRRQGGEAPRRADLPALQLVRRRCPPRRLHVPAVCTSRHSPAAGPSAAGSSRRFSCCSALASPSARRSGPRSRLPWRGRSPCGGLAKGSAGS